MRARGLAKVALVPPAAFAVHQLRFLLAFGHGAGAQLALSGHSYLHSVLPWLIGLLGLSAGLFLRALGRALAGRRPLDGQPFSGGRPLTQDHTPSARRSRAGAFLTLWLACTVALIGIYTAQELLEGAFLLGHLPGLNGAFGFGGLWAIPAAAGVGLVLASLFLGAGAVLARAARRVTPRHVGGPVRPPQPLPQASLLAVPAPLARGWSLRGPPVG